MYFSHICLLPQFLPGLPPFLTHKLSALLQPIKSSLCYWYMVECMAIHLWVVDPLGRHIFKVDWLCLSQQLSTFPLPTFLLPFLKCFRALDSGEVMQMGLLKLSVPHSLCPGPVCPLSPELWLGTWWPSRVRPSYCFWITGSELLYVWNRRFFFLWERDRIFSGLGVDVEIYFGGSFAAVDLFGD